MFTALAIVVAAFQAPLPSTWAGVWATPQGVHVVITPTGSVQAMVGERLAFGMGITQVPDGFFVGNWYGGRMATFCSGDAKRVPLAPSTQWSTFLAQLYGRSQLATFRAVMPVPAKSSTAADYGQIRVGEGTKDGYGNLQNLRFELTDGNRAAKLSGLLSPSLSVEAINVAGTFSDGMVTMNLTDDGASLGGAVTFNQSRFILKGMRVAARGGFNLTDGATGQAVGRGYVAWTPTPGRVSSSRGKAYQTDQVTVLLEMPGFPNGTDRVLSRK